MRFEWDPAKSEANRVKHGLSFEEAAELLRGCRADPECAQGDPGGASTIRGVQEGRT
jgi:hypothetical protein